MENKIKYIQLNNGTELISKVDFKDWEHVNYIKLYDTLRIYSIPPFLGPEGSNHQTLILIKWLPWTDDIFFTISTDKLLVITDVSSHMQEYYTSTLQKYTETDIENEFNESMLPAIGKENNDDNDNDDEEQEENVLLEATPENLKELTNILNSLIKKPKRTLH